MINGRAEDKRRAVARLIGNGLSLGRTPVAAKGTALGAESESLGPTRTSPSPAALAGAGNVAAGSGRRMTSAACSDSLAEAEREETRCREAQQPGQRRRRHVPG